MGFGDGCLGWVLGLPWPFGVAVGVGVGVGVGFRGSKGEPLASHEDVVRM
jgi:hypothetical protein